MGMTHDLETPDNVFVWDALVKEITHRVDEYLLWRLDMQHPFEPLWKELHLGERFGVLFGHGRTIRTPATIVLEVDGMSFVMQGEGITVATSIRDASTSD